MKLLAYDWLAHISRIHRQICTSSYISRIRRQNCASSYQIHTSQASYYFFESNLPEFGDRTLQDESFVAF